MNKISASGISGQNSGKFRSSLPTKNRSARCTFYNSNDYQCCAPKYCEQQKVRYKYRESENDFRRCVYTPF